MRIHLLLLGFILAWPASSTGFAQPFQRPLDGSWYVREDSAGTWREAEWCDLLLLRSSSACTDDPQAMGTPVYKEYKTTFLVQDSLLRAQRLELAFDRLPPDAAIYLNDELIERRGSRLHVAIGNRARMGVNELSIVFGGGTTPVLSGQSPSATTDASRTVDLPTADCLCDGKVRERHAAVAAHPGHPAPIRLQWWRTATIRRLDIRTVQTTKDRAVLDLHLEIEATRHFFGRLSVTIDGTVVREKTAEVRFGENNDVLTISIDDLKRWWPYRHGSQRMYNVSVCLWNDSIAVATASARKGFRTVELSENDGRGTGPALMINGEPFTVRGAVYRTAPATEAQVTGERLKHLLMTVRNAGINTVLLQASGTAAPPALYNLCDSLGLIVWKAVRWEAWQMMDATSAVHTGASTPAVVHMVQRHPSVVALVGATPAQRSATVSDRGLEEYIAQMCRQTGLVHLDADALETFGCPVLLYPDPVPMDREGTSTAQGKDEGLPCIMMPSLSSMRAMHCVADSAVLNDSLRLLESIPAPRHSFEYTVDAVHQQFGSVSTAKRLSYYSQLLQAHQIGGMITRRRLAEAEGAGAFYCHISEDRPGISYAAVDYCGEPKAVWYAMRRSFEALLIDAELDGDRIRVVAVNGGKEDLNARCTVEICNFEGKVLYRHEGGMRLRSGEAGKVHQGSVAKILRRYRPDEIYARVRVHEEDTAVVERRSFFARYGDLQLPEPQLTVEVSEDGDSVGVQLTTDHMAAVVRLSCESAGAFFEDNFFSVDPDAVRYIRVHGIEADELRNCLKVECMPF